MGKFLTRSIALASALTLLFTSSVFAGAWTHIDENGYDWGNLMYQSIVHLQIMAHVTMIMHLTNGIRQMQKDIFMLVIQMVQLLTMVQTGIDIICNTKYIWQDYKAEMTCKDNVGICNEKTNYVSYFSNHNMYGLDRVQEQ